MSLEGKVAIITGASRGIGRSIAYRLARQGVKLAIVSRTEKQLRETHDELIKYTPVYYEAFDIRDEEKVIKFVKKTVKKYGKIDFLINNAGYVKPLSLLETTLEDWKTQIDINLTGSFLMTREVVRYMKEYGGKIINIASTAGLTPRPGWSAYAASKAALINFSLTMAEELKQYGIRVYCIAPGRTATELRKLLAPDEDQSKILQPENVAELVETLLTEKGDYVDGQVIIIRRRII